MLCYSMQNLKPQTYSNHSKPMRKLSRLLLLQNLDVYNAIFHASYKPPLAKQK